LSHHSTKCCSGRIESQIDLALKRAGTGQRDPRRNPIVRLVLAAKVDKSSSAVKEARRGGKANNWAPAHKRLSEAAEGSRWAAPGEADEVIRNVARSFGLAESEVEEPVQAFTGGKPSAFASAAEKANIPGLAKALLEGSAELKIKFGQPTTKRRSDPTRLESRRGGSFAKSQAKPISRRLPRRCVRSPLC